MSPDRISIIFVWLFFVAASLVSVARGQTISPFNSARLQTHDRAQIASGQEAQSDRELALSNTESAREPEFEADEEQDEIETDRDSFTPATSTVRCGQFVLESAYSFIDNRTVPETHSFPELLVRYGASDILEIRIGSNYEVGGIGSPISGNVSQDFTSEPELEESARVMYGAKIFLTEQCGWTPQSSFIIQGFTPTAGESNDSQLSATPVFGWKLANDWVWDCAMRYGTGNTDDDRFDVWSPSTVLKIPVGEKWKAHIEYFGVMTEGREIETTQHFVSPGAHYLITRDFEVGIRVGWGLNVQSPNFFSNVGIGWQF